LNTAVSRRENVVSARFPLDPCKNHAESEITRRDSLTVDVGQHCP
jgi:hypothetical protein